jgi:hypothetical protein
MLLPRDDGAAPDWPHLQATAEAHGGYFSLREAQAHGISRQLLQHHLGRGGIRRVGRAAFQLSSFAPSPHEDCVAAWLWSRGQGVLSHETALFLHGLVDERPLHVHLTLPTHWLRLRLRAPAGVIAHHANLLDEHCDGAPPLPFTALDHALIEGAWFGQETALVESAFLRARDRGLRDAGTLRLWTPPLHPLRRHFPIS